MEISEHIDALAGHGEGLAAAADKAGSAADVPTCPGWTVRHLLEHVGKVHRWAATYVRDGREAFGGGLPRMAKPPADGLLEWYLTGHAELVAALRAAPADLDCWTFLPAPSPLAFWARRQAHETAIHRADADAASGTVLAFDPPFAADGIGELFDGFYARRGGTLLADPPRSLLVAPIDDERRWHLTIGPDRRRVGTGGEPAVPPADCTVRGPAADLYLLLWNRPPARQPQVDGDADVLRLWRELAKITWR